MARQAPGGESQRAAPLLSPIPEEQKRKWKRWAEEEDEKITARKKLPDSKLSPGRSV
jgi:hypothetical protein